MDGNGNNNGGKGKIDLVSLAMTGLTRGEAKEMGYEVVPMTLEESYAVNKDLDAVKDMEMEQYGGLYQASYLDQTMINSDDQEAIATEKLTIGQLSVGPMQLPMNPAILGQEYDKPFEIWNTAITAQDRGTIYDERGVLTNLWTDEEAADDKGVYYAIENGEYVEKPLVEYNNMNELGYPFRVGENGS